MPEKVVIIVFKLATTCCTCKTLVLKLQDIHDDKIVLFVINKLQCDYCLIQMFY